MRNAVQRLGEIMAGIVRTAEEKNRERCGYKAMNSVCTFIGGCMNREQDKCGGDEFVRKAQR